MTHTLHTPTNVALEVQLAPLGERSLAFVIDFAVVVIGVSLLVQLILAPTLTAIAGEDNFLQLFLYFAFPLASLLGYFALAEYFAEGLTLGKRVLGLRTIRVDGAPPTFETFGLRSAMLIVDFVLGLGAIGLLAAGSSPMRQRVGDRVAQSLVIRRTPRELYRLEDILAIRSVEGHEVRYPQAADLDVEQALLIKELIVTSERHGNDAVRALVRETARALARDFGLAQLRGDLLEFLRQVLRDYIVLTR